MSSESPETSQATTFVPQVTIVIVTHNSLPALSACLDALPAACSSVPFELILVDNASIDGSADVSVPSDIPHRKVSKAKNLGFARSCNAGANLASGEFLLFLNPDVTLDPGSVPELLSVTTNHPGAGLVTGRMRYPDGSFQATCRKFPTVKNLLWSRGSILHRWFGPDIDRESRYTLPDYSEPTEVPAVAAAMVMIRREQFTSLGGFDPRFFLYMEDTDLSLRINRSGLVNVFVPGAGGVHALGTGSRIGRMRRRRLQSIAVWKYFLKYNPNGLSLFVLPVMLAVNWLLALVIPPENGGV